MSVREAISVKLHEIATPLLPAAQQAEGARNDSSSGAETQLCLCLLRARPAATLRLYEGGGGGFQRELEE